MLKKDNKSEATKSMYKCHNKIFMDRARRYNIKEVSKSVFQDFIQYFKNSTNNDGSKKSDNTIK